MLEQHKNYSKHNRFYKQVLRLYSNYNLNMIIYTCIYMAAQPVVL